MRQRYRKKYYIPGIISLVLLPALFWLSNSDAQDEAIHYGSIEVLGNIGCGVELPEDSLYVLEWKNSTIDYDKLEQFLAIRQQGPPSGKIDWTKRYRFILPDSVPYGTVVHCIDILHKHKFLCGISEQTMMFTYFPRQFTEPKIVRRSTKDEFEYAVEQSKALIASLKQRLSNIPPLRVMKYSDEGPPPPPPYGLGDHVFYSNTIIEEEPRSAVLFRELGSWFLPIAIGWWVLLFLGVKRK